MTGPPGSGRTRVLDDFHRDLVDAGRQVVALCFTPDGVLTPAALPDGRGSGEKGFPLGPRKGASTDPDVARRAARAVASALVSREAVLLVDDAQWADHDALAVMEALVHRLEGSRSRCIVAVRTPGRASLRAAGVAATGRLRAAGLATAVRVGPLGAEEIARAVNAAVEAVPSRDLLDAVRARTRRVAAAADAVVESLRTDGAVQIVDRHAYLTDGASPPEGQLHLLAAVQRLGPQPWAAAKALAVLHPLGSTAPALVADALGCGVERAEELLETLRAAGFVHRGRSGRAWRFLVPDVAAALHAACGPFEGHRLAALAVEAVWEGRAQCDDTVYLTDRVAEAGRQLPAGLAQMELVAQASRALFTDPGNARRWWRAAAAMADDHSSRIMALRTESAACFLCGDYVGCVDNLRAIQAQGLDDLPGRTTRGASLLLVAALYNSGDVHVVADVADGRAPAGPDEAAAAVCRSFSLGLLDRWDEARQLLGDTRPSWSVSTDTQPNGEIFEALAHLFCGNPGLFDKQLAAGPQWVRQNNEEYRYSHANVVASALLYLGDLNRCEEFLGAERVAEDRLYLSTQAALSMMRGDRPASGDVLDAARRTLAAGAVHGHDSDRATMVAGAAMIMIGRGWVSGARELLATARRQRPVLAHLLDAVDTLIDVLTGERAAAERRLRDALAETVRLGLVVGRDALLTELAGLCHARGDDPGARAALADLEEVARALPTPRTTMFVALTRALVDVDRDAARECLAVARGRRAPWELAVVTLRLVENGLADPAELLPAYETFARYDALLYRAWTRSALSDHGITVPGRQVTVEENERLLAILVAEGLSNRLIATTLRTSEKSVEGRLSRLYAHTGYESRMKLATAVQRGELDP